MTGKDVKFNRDYQIERGSYVQAHEFLDPINRPEDFRSVGAMSLGPSENKQGGCYFMILETEKRIHRLKWTVLPFTYSSSS